MADTRRRNENWSVANTDGNVPTWERVSIAVLMDIRDELQTLNRVFQCTNFLRIPYQLDMIRKQTAKKKKKVMRQKVTR